MINHTSTPYPGRLLKIGSRGAAVELLQSFLTELNIAYPSLHPLVPDGIFGEHTAAAVLGFQRIFGLAPDGTVGPITWYAITNEVIRQREQKKEFVG